MQTCNKPTISSLCDGNILNVARHKVHDLSHPGMCETMKMSHTYINVHREQKYKMSITSPG